MRLLILFAALISSTAVARPLMTQKDCESVGGQWSGLYQGFKCTQSIPQAECMVRASEGWGWDRRKQECSHHIIPRSAEDCTAAGGRWGKYVAVTEHCFFEDQHVAQKNNCAAQGGEWKRLGIMGFEHCVLPARDAGKPCSDGSECEYGCRGGSKAIGDGDRAIGSCAHNSNGFGCYSTIVNGKTGGRICVD